jgi:hypothetical protein
MKVSPLYSSTPAVVNINQPSEIEGGDDESIYVCTYSTFLDKLASTVESSFAINLISPI